MSKKIRPISINAFPDVDTNCFGFAIGNIEQDGESKIYNLNPYLSPADSFLSKLKKLGYTNLPRKIDKLEDVTDGEYVFMIYGFKWIRIRNDSILGFSSGKKYPDYHVLRREPNGIWVHKSGWKNRPCLVTGDDWISLSRNFGHNFALLAFKPEKEE